MIDANLHLTRIAQMTFCFDDSAPGFWYKNHYVIGGFGKRGKNPGEIFLSWGIPKSEGFVIRSGYDRVAPRY